jgi:hypothetical protein
MTDDVRRYAAAVRAALADLDAAERGALLDDLEAHLAEVAAESGAPLAERLGPPERYAAELRVAYGAPPRRRGVLPALRAPSPRSRRLRPAYVALMAVVAAGLLLSWQVVSRQMPGDRWSPAELVTRARAGQVRSLDVSGSTVVATDRAGGRHDVAAASVGPDLASAMTAAGVDVNYSQGSSSQAWLTVVLPNAMLVILIAGMAALLLWRARRRPAFR